MAPYCAGAVVCGCGGESGRQLNGIAISCPIYKRKQNRSG